MKSTTDLVQIASYGGGMIVSATKSTADLVQIASYAAVKGSHVIIRGANQKPTADLVQIASFGKGAVIFDFTD